MGNNYRLTITDPTGGKERILLFRVYTWHVSPRDYIPYQNRTVNNLQAPKTRYYIDTSITKGRIKKITYPEGGYQIRELRYGNRQTE